MGSAFPLKKKPVHANKIVYLSQGNYNGRETWHYLLIDKLKLPILLKEAKGHEIDLSHYGNIIFSGFGKNPPDAVKRCVQNKYGNAA